MLYVVGLDNGKCIGTMGKLKLADFTNLNEPLVARFLSDKKLMNDKENNNI